MEVNWCHNFEVLLKNLKTNEHDQMEKITEAVLNLLDHCKEAFSPSFSDILSELSKNYEKLSKHEEKNDFDDYFLNIFIKTKKILNTLKEFNKNEEL
jgi:hypothetical protein